MKRLTTALLTVSLMTTLAVGASARPKPTPAAKRRARALFTKAERYYDLAVFDKAMELYRKAYALAPLSGFLFNIGQCLRRQGKHAEAYVYYHRYLAARPRARNRALVLKAIRETERLLRKRGVPIPSVPTTDTADDDGDAWAVGAGSRKAAGGGDSNAADGARSTAGQGGQPGDAAQGDASSGADGDDRGGSRGLLTAGIVVSAALAAVATVTGILAQKKSDEFGDRSVIRRHDELDALKSEGQKLAVASVVSMSTAGVCALATLIYYLRTRRHGSAKRAARDEGRVGLHAVAPMVAAGAGGLVVGGRF